MFPKRVSSALSSSKKSLRLKHHSAQASFSQLFRQSRSLEVRHNKNTIFKICELQSPKKPNPKSTTIHFRKSFTSTPPEFPKKRLNQNETPLIHNQNYIHAYQKSQQSPEAFWKTYANDISWSKPFRKVAPEPGSRSWFSGGELNASYNALDRHLEKRGDCTALVWDSPVTQQKTTLTFSELSKKTNEIAYGLKKLGAEKGDVILIYSPMIPETIAVSLAAARLGCTYTHVFAGFAPKELATRIEDSKPKFVIYGSCGVEKNRVIPYQPFIDEALNMTNHQPTHRIVIQRSGIFDQKLTRKNEKSLEEIMEDGKWISPVSVSSDHPLYILYTSGTTGTPKGVIRDTGGYLTALKYSMRSIYRTEAEDVFWAASDLGWVVGQSYIIWAPLIHGCTSVLYEGKPVGTPDAGQFWRVIEDYKVNTIFMAPTAARAIRQKDPEAQLLSKYNTSSLNTFFVAGERCDIPTLNWIQSRFPHLPVIDHWWMTETGWSITASHFSDHIMSFPPRFGSAGKPVPGNNLVCLNPEKDFQPTTHDETGLFFLKEPLAPGNLIGLWQNEKRFQKYFEKLPGYFETGDTGFLDEEGYAHIMSRNDDLINVAGHRLSTGSIESCLNHHPAVAENCCVSLYDSLRGEIPVSFVVLQEKYQDVDRSHQNRVAEELCELVRKELGPVYCFYNCVFVKHLPKTRSGKITRSTIKKIIHQEPWTVPSTIEDPTVLSDLEEIIKKTEFIHQK